MAATLGERLRRGGLTNGFRVADVYLQGWPGLDTVERARIAIRVLVDAGWVRAGCAPGDGNGGSAREAFMVNPAIYAQ